MEEKKAEGVHRVRPLLIVASRCIRVSVAGHPANCHPDYLGSRVARYEVHTYMIRSRAARLEARMLAQQGQGSHEPPLRPRLESPPRGSVLQGKRFRLQTALRQTRIRTSRLGHRRPVCHLNKSHSGLTFPSLNSIYCPFLFCHLPERSAHTHTHLLLLFSYNSLQRELPSLPFRYLAFSSTTFPVT